MAPAYTLGAVLRAQHLACTGCHRCHWPRGGTSLPTPSAEGERSVGGFVHEGAPANGRMGIQGAPPTHGCFVIIPVIAVFCRPSTHIMRNRAGGDSWERCTRARARQAGREREGAGRVERREWAGVGRWAMGGGGDVLGGSYGTSFAAAPVRSGHVWRYVCMYVWMYVWRRHVRMSACRMYVCMAMCEVPSACTTPCHPIRCGTDQTQTAPRCTYWTVDGAVCCVAWVRESSAALRLRIFQNRMIPARIIV